MAEPKEQSGVLKAVSSLKPGDCSEDLYDRWAADYDQDLLEEWGYDAPRQAVAALAARCPDRKSLVADLGCGTGLVGEALATEGYEHFDGLDVSEGMLAQAEAKGLYRRLIKGDLTARTPLGGAAYDAVLCVGSMGAGHVDAGHLPEILRVLKPGGFIVIYMNGQHYLDEGFEAKFRAQEAAGLWRIEAIEASNYMAALERPGRLLVGRKPEAA